MKAKFSNTAVLSWRMPVEGLDVTRQFIAYPIELYSQTATSDEHGFVGLAIVGDFECVKNRSRITIANARRLFASPMIQEGEIGRDFKAWLKYIVNASKDL